MREKKFRKYIGPIKSGIAFYGLTNMETSAISTQCGTHCLVMATHALIIEAKLFDVQIDQINLTSLLFWHTL